MYLIFRLFQVVPTTTNVLRSENLKIETYQISELLINDGGHPIDWNIQPLNEIKRIGLSDSIINKTNFVSSRKISQLNSICESSYSDVKRLLDVENEVSISFFNYDTNEKWICTSARESRASFNVTRIVSVDGTQLAEITVEVRER